MTNPTSWRPARKSFVFLLFLFLMREQTLFAQGPPGGAEASDPWTVVITGLAGFAVLVGIIVAIIVQQKKKLAKRMVAGTTSATENLLGGYRLLNLLMTGQTSQVWEATEVASGRHFAIKLLLPECAGEAEHRQFLFHEAEVGMQLAHPNIIRIVSVCKDAEHPHFVMDFFPGGNLKMRILHKEVDFIREKTHDILKQAATALAFMNAQGWVHRDIKPENILVNAAGEVRVIDLAIAQAIPKGLAKMFYRKKAKAQGTPSYMSPEQIRNEPLDGRSDVYSLGAAAYELVSGRTPFRAANPSDLLLKHLSEKPVSPQMHNPEVTEEFANFVLQMLAKKKENRPVNFHEVLMTLRKIKVFNPHAKKEESKKSEGPTKGLPTVGTYVMTCEGKAKVVSQQELARKIMVQYEDGRRIVIGNDEVLSRSEK